MKLLILMLLTLLPGCALADEVGSLKFLSHAKPPLHYGEPATMGVDPAFTADERAALQAASQDLASLDVLVTFVEMKEPHAGTVTRGRPSFGSYPPGANCSSSNDLFEVWIDGDQSNVREIAVTVLSGMAE